MINVEVEVEYDYVKPKKIKNTTQKTTNDEEEIETKPCNIYF